MRSRTCATVAARCTCNTVTHSMPSAMKKVIAPRTCTNRAIEYAVIVLSLQSYDWPGANVPGPCLTLFIHTIQLNKWRDIARLGGVVSGRMGRWTCIVGESL